MNDPKKKEPGYYVGIGIALGAGIGSAIGVALSNISMGVALGISIGVAIGAGLEEDAKKRGEIRELTKEEEHARVRTSRIAFVVGLLVAVVVASLFVYLVRR